MINNSKIIVACAVLAGLASSATASERAPTASESAAISSALNTLGYSSWGTIELDDGKWEVDNAVHTDGKVYDVDLRLSDLSVIKKDLED
jgi:hypothetical protein